MSALPTYAKGLVDLTTLSVQPLSIAADGTISNNGSAINVIAYYKTLKLTQKNALEEHSGTSLRGENNIILSSATDLEFTGYVLKNDTSGAANLIAEAAQANDQFRVSWTRSLRVWTYVGVLETYEETVEGKSAIMFNVTLKPVNIGSSNPVLS